MQDVGPAWRVSYSRRPPASGCRCVGRHVSYCTYIFVKSNYVHHSGAQSIEDMLEITRVAWSLWRGNMILCMPYFLGVILVVCSTVSDTSLWYRGYPASRITLKGWTSSPSRDPYAMKCHVRCATGTHASQTPWSFRKHSRHCHCHCHCHYHYHCHPRN